MEKRNPENLIEGVKIKQLKPIPDERGMLMELLRSDEPMFERFGQAYVTVCKPKVVKGWHYHKRQVDHFVCLKGTAKVVLYDARTDSKTFKLINEFMMGWDNPILVRIPTYVYHGFTAMGKEKAMILNIPTEVYKYKEPDEFRASPFTDKIPYDWGNVNRTISK